MGEVPEMVEKVAMAICIHITDIPMTEQEWRWGAAENPAEARSFRNAARAAIEAMREPTVAMADAGRWPGEDGEPMEAWRAMVDAALSDTHSKGSETP